MQWQESSRGHKKSMSSGLKPERSMRMGALFQTFKLRRVGKKLRKCMMTWRTLPFP